MYAYKTNPTKPAGRDNKVLGADDYSLDHERSHSIAYTGIWSGGVLVALAVAASGIEPEDLDAMEVTDVLRARCEELTHKLNGYDILLEHFNASNAFVNAMGTIGEDEAIEVAVQRERDAEARFEKATQAVQELLRGAA